MLFWTICCWISRRLLEPGQHHFQGHTWWVQIPIGFTRRSWNSESNRFFMVVFQRTSGIPQHWMNEWMNIYFTEVFRLVHHFTCIYTSSWISHTSDSHKSFNIDIYISCILPAVRASFVQGLYFWFRVFKVIIPVYQYITKFFLRFSTLATGTLRSWSARHQFDACASRWCSTDANPSVPMVRAISTFSFVLKEEMKTSVGIPEEVALSSWSPYICYDFYFSYWFCYGSISIYKTLISE